MAKPGNNNNKKPQPNYFKKELQRRGNSSVPTTFMADKNAVQRNRDAMSIMRDIAAGNIDIQNEGQYILQQPLLDQVISTAYSKWYYHSIAAQSILGQIQNTTATYGQAAVDPNMFAVYEQENKSATVFSIFYNIMTNIKLSGDYIGWLPVLINQINNARLRDNIK